VWTAVFELRKKARGRLDRESSSQNLDSKRPFFVRTDRVLGTPSDNVGRVVIGSQVTVVMEGAGDG